MRPFLFAFAALALSVAPALAASPIEGEWLTAARNARVRIAACPGAADTLCGQISWLQAPTNPDGGAKHDVNNPDAKLQARPILGLAMLSGFKADGDRRWNGGTIYDPQSGRTYKSKLTLNANGSLKVEGCVLVVCQGQTWTRP